MMKRLLQAVGGLRRSWIVFAHDLLMVPIAWLGAYWARFNLGTIPVTYLDQALRVLPWVMLVQAVSFYLFGLYRGVWRFASMPDLVRIIKAVTLGSLATMVLLFLVYRLDGVPRSLIALFPLLLLVLLSGPRLIYRWSKDKRLSVNSGTRVLIVGAGQAGSMLARDLIHNPDVYQPIGFVDDKQRRHGQDILGIPVLGGSEAIPQLAESLDIDLLILAIPSANNEEMQRLVRLCESSGVPFRTLPPLDMLMDGRVELNQLREVSIEDILGRDPVSLDWQGIRGGLQGKTILVTGAGGSIGSELCRQVAGLEPKTLVLLENGEFNLYRIDNELRKAFPALDLATVLGDVRDAERIDQLFARTRPDVVFHAAAYKHVPMLEDQAREAILNNVIGTRTVALAADRAGASEFVLISTDKAVNPANIMGATKRIAEIFCQNLDARSNTRYITVRFGNVLDSAGSVVPLFREQIRAGGPVTVTHEDIERYFMTIPEATQLILQAAVLGDGGEIFVLDMGSPVKIRFLAEQMIRLSGKTPDRDIAIEITGLRPGEKLYEELFHDQEKLDETSHAKILLARHRHVDWEQLNTTIDELKQLASTSEESDLRQKIAELVPEHRFQPR